MRTQLASLGIDRLAIGGALAVVLGLAASGWMILNLSKRSAAAAKLQLTVDNLKPQAATLSTSETPPEDPQIVRERLSRFVSPASAVPQLLEQLSLLASENHLGDVFPGVAEKPVDPASPDGAILKELGITKAITITVPFKAEYADAARFMGAAALLPRPLSVKSVQLHREFPSMTGTVVFEGFLAN